MKPISDEYAKLLQACKEEHHDYAPCYALADWLSKSKQPPERDRGEYLRMHCDREQLGRNHPDDAAITARLHELTMKHRDAWFTPFQTQLHINGLFHRRGLLECYLWDRAVVLKAIKALRIPLARHPVFAWLTGITLEKLFGKEAENQLMHTTDVSAITEIRVSGISEYYTVVPPTMSPQRYGHAHLNIHSGPEELEWYADTPLLDGVRSVRVFLVNDKSRTPHMAALARAPWLRTVTSLNLWGCRIPAEPLKTLLAAPHLGPLRRLNLAANRVGDAGLAAIAECERLANLEYLNVRSNQFTDTGLTALAMSLHLRNLRFLSIAGTYRSEIGPGLAALVQSPVFAGVTESQFSTKSEAAVEALATSPYTRSLQRLDMALYCPPGSAVRMLSQSTALPALRYLSLISTLQGDDLERFLAGPVLKNLETIRFHLDGIPREAVADRFRYLRDPALLPSLKSLEMWVSEKHREAFVEALNRSPLLRRVRRLSLMMNFKDAPPGFFEGLFKLIDEGIIEDLSIFALPPREMKRFAQCRGLSRIVRLRMCEDAGMGSKAFEHLVRSPHWCNLRILKFDQCPVKTAGKWLPLANMPRLTAVDICDASQDDPLLQQFKQSRPEVDFLLANPPIRVLLDPLDNEND